jgi:hypothetical protein
MVYRLVVCFKGCDMKIDDGSEVHLWNLARVIYYFLSFRQPTKTQNYFPQEHGRTAHPWWSLCCHHKWPLDLVHAAMHGVPQPSSNLEDLIWKDYNKKAFSLHWPCPHPKPSRSWSKPWSSKLPSTMPAQKDKKK